MAHLGNTVINGALRVLGGEYVDTINGVTVGSSPKFTDTTYSSKTAASGGTEVSLVTTGEKYTWNNKSNLAIGTTATTAAAGNHTHAVTITADSGTNQLTLAASTKYKITAGGSSYIFTTPPNTTYSSKTAASGGTDVSLVTTGEKYTWNNKSNLAIGTTASTAAAGNHTHSLTIATDTGTSALNMAANTTYKITAGGSTFIFKTPVDNNTWRGIQDNLTSSTNTTESLSAKQGYLLANGSARDSTKVMHRGNAGKSNMNDVGKLYPSVGMTNLTDPSNNTDNPMTGTTKSTGWHLYWDSSYSDDPSGSNAWVAQICNKAGSSQWWVRSRGGGTITNGTAWNAPWTHLVVSPQTGQGGTTTPIYIDENGHTQNCSYTIAKSVPSNAKFTDTTYSSQAAASGGTAVSLVTTGEKYTWNNKSNLAIGTTATTAAAGNHTHTVTIAADSGTSALTMAANTKYKLTAGGSTFIFTTPPDNNTNNAVTQTATTTSANYEVLFSATADNTTRTEGTRKNSNLTFNPSTGNLTVTKVNGESVKYSSSVNAVVGDTTCTISDSSITTSSLIETFSSNSTGDTITIKNIAVTAGQAVLTFKALTVDTSFRLRITNI